MRFFSARTLLAVSGCALLTAGCATLQEPFQAHLRSSEEPVRSCAQWYAALDAQIDAAGVRDAQYTQMAGFPYLRVDRLMAALRDRAARNESALDAFSRRLMELDQQARQFEIENLPGPAFEALPGMARGSPRDAVLSRTQSCAALLRERDLAQPAGRAALLAAAQVPDDYSDAGRALGVYPLSRFVFSRGVRRWEEQARAGFAAPPGEPAGASAVRYAPPTAMASRVTAAALLERAELDPLGLPRLSERELPAYAAAYAPTFEVAIAGDADRFGELRWWSSATTPEVNSAEAVVYVQQAHTRYADRILLQLVYTIWFPERPGAEGGDMLAGALDGLVWRVTLAPDGEPLLYDSIHPCGCYHEFFPTPRARLRPPPNATDEWAFVPLSLPRVGDGERPMVRIAAGTHYIEGVTLVRGAGSVARYGLRSYDELRSMPRLEGGRRSAFGPDGLVPGTERGERFLFWPMGVRSAGAMRQWGRQATAFVGRRHFDDAGLIERRFELDLSSPGFIKASPS